jgi:hypothetical protein
LLDEQNEFATNDLRMIDIIENRRPNGAAIHAIQPYTHRAANR